MERLLWVKDFIRKDTFAPFSCNRDEDYYSILSENTKDFTVLQKKLAQIKKV